MARQVEEKNRGLKKKKLDHALVRDLFGNELKQCQSFKHLGTVVDRSGSVSADIDRRIGAAWSVLNSMKSIWSKRTIKKELKRTLYLATVTSVLLYNADIWLPTGTDLKKLVEFQRKSLARIKEWGKRSPATAAASGDSQPRDELCKEFGITDIEVQLQEMRVKWIAHVMRESGSTTCKNTVLAEIVRHQTPWGKMAEADLARYGWSAMTVGNMPATEVSEQITIRRGMSEEEWIEYQEEKRRKREEEREEMIRKEEERVTLLAKIDGKKWMGVSNNMEAWLEEDETVKFKVKVNFDEVTGKEEVTAAGVVFKNIGGEIYKKQSRGH